MRSGSMWRLLGGVGFAVGSWACSSSAPDELTLATQSEEISGGVVESGYPAIGMAVNTKRQFCTGSLVATQWVLTYEICGTISTFRANGKTYNADRQVTNGPFKLVHLTRPVAGVQPLLAEAGTGPVQGQQCTAVAFMHDSSTTPEYKRSATEFVTDFSFVIVGSTAYSGIWVRRGTGIVSLVDAGSPLICNGRIAGLVYGVTADERAVYLKVPWSWLQSVLGLSSCGNAAVDAGEQCDFAAQPSGCGADQACAGTCTCFTPTPQPACEITCSPNEDMLCGDIQGCNLFCYSSAWAPDPSCPALGCSDRMCSGQVVVHTAPPAPPPSPAPGPYQGSCSAGYVDCDQYGWGTGCRPGSQPDYGTCF